LAFAVNNRDVAITVQSLVNRGSKILICKTCKRVFYAMIDKYKKVFTTANNILHTNDSPKNLI